MRAELRVSLVQPGEIKDGEKGGPQDLFPVRQSYSFFSHRGTPRRHSEVW